MTVAGEAGRRPKPGAPSTVPIVAKRLAKQAPHFRNGARAAGLIFLVLVVMVVGSLSMYWPTRTTQSETTLWGDVDNPDRVDITAWITKVDTAAETISVTMTDIRPQGTFLDDGGFFRDDATVFTLTSLQNTTVPIKKGDYSPVIEQRFALVGMVTDYPFDRYSAALEFHVTGGPEGEELPVAVTLLSTDPFFAVSAAEAPSQEGGSSIALNLRRSTPTLVYTSFVMVLMLGLAVAAATAAYYALKQRKGLLFPACSMMAGMLFALVPLRNAVPGSPPIGSIIDFASFFIAAITIAVSLITCVAVGYRVQLVKDRDDDENDRLVAAAYAKYLETSDDDWRTTAR